MVLNVYGRDHISPKCEEALGDAMRRQWEYDLDVVRSKGIRPDWEGEPSLIDKSLARVLNHIYENGLMEITSSPSRRRSEITAALGFRTVENMKDAVSRCVDLGYLDTFIHRGDAAYQITKDGESALADWIIDMEISGLDVVSLMMGYDYETRERDFYDGISAL